MIIIIRGPAGVGKTTVAKKLGGYTIHADDLLKEHDLDYKEGEECVPEENFFKINSIIMKIIKKVDGLIIIETNFYHINCLKDLISKIGKCFVFTLKASLQTCIERDRLRKGIGARRVKEVYELVNRFDYGIIVDTEWKTADEVVEDIRKIFDGKTAGF